MGDWGRGGGKGGFGENRPSYDGRNVQKAFSRETNDYNAACAAHMRNRVFVNNRRRDRVILPPDPMHAFRFEPPLAWADAPETCFATRMVKSVRNKRPGGASPIFIVLWTPQGHRLLTGQSSGEVIMWNGLAFNFEAPCQAHNAATRTMVWTNKEQWLVTGDDEGKIRYFQSSLNKVMEFDAHYRDEDPHGLPQLAPIRELCMCPTDAKVASGSDDATVKIWDFETTECEHTLKALGSEVKTVQWHPYKALIASGAKDNKVRLWDPRMGRQLCALDAHNRDVSQVRWNRNGNWLLSCGRDNMIKLFDIRKMSDFRKYTGHQTEVMSLAWHPVHEDLFASGDKNGRLVYWLAGSEEPQDEVPIAHDGHIWSLAWHHLGHMLCSGSNDQTAKFWTRQHPGDTEADRYTGAPARHPSWLQNMQGSGNNGTAGIGSGQDSGAPMVNRQRGERIRFSQGDTLLPGLGASLPSERAPPPPPPSSARPLPSMDPGGSFPSAMQSVMEPAYNEPQPTAAGPDAPTCKDFQNGKCTRGSGCRYRHALEEQDPMRMGRGGPMRRERSPPRQPAPYSAGAGGSYGRNDSAAGGWVNASPSAAGGKGGAAPNPLAALGIDPQKAQQLLKMAAQQDPAMLAQVLGRVGAGGNSAQMEALMRALGANR